MYVSNHYLCNLKNKKHFRDMTFSSFIAKLRYGSYQDSSRPSVYEEIADIFKVEPQHVYEIAHGKKALDRHDSQIFDELVARGIIVNTFI